MFFITPGGSEGPARPSGFKLLSQHNNSSPLCRPAQRGVSGNPMAAAAKAAVIGRYFDGLPLAPQEISGRQV